MRKSFLVLRIAITHQHATISVSMQTDLRFREHRSAVEELDMFGIEQPADSAAAFKLSSCGCCTCVELLRNVILS